MALAAMELSVSNVTNETAGALPIDVNWSASLAAAGAADKPIPGNASKPFLVRALAQADAYVATGSTKAEAITNAQGGKRQAVLAKQYYDFYANPGDYVAWSAA